MGRAAPKCLQNPGRLQYGSKVFAENVIAPPPRVSSFAVVVTIRAWLCGLLLVGGPGIACHNRPNTVAKTDSIPVSTSSSATAEPTSAARPETPSLVGTRDGYCRVVEGRVRCWGFGFGPTPRDVAGIGDALSVSVEDHDACALRKSGRIDCWRRFDVRRVPPPGGQIEPRLDRLDVSDAVTWHQRAGRGCATLRNGTVKCWKFAPPTQRDPPEPLTVPVIQDAARVVAGSCTCLRDLAGGVSCFGHGCDAYVDVDASRPTDTLIPIPNARNVLDLWSSPRTLCLLQSSGIECRTRLSPEQAGGGSFVDTPSMAPRPRPPVRSVNVVLPASVSPPVAFLASDPGKPCIRHTAGEVSCWDEGGQAKLVDKLPGPVVAYAESDRSACGELVDGRVLCRGSNGSGQLGQLHGAFVHHPVRVAVNDAIAVSAGSWHACAIRQDKSVWCWGKDAFSPASQPPAVPRRIAAFSGALILAAGDHNTCVRTKDGAVRCAGLLSALLRAVKGGSDVSWLDKIAITGLPSTVDPSPLELPTLRGADELVVGQLHVCGRFAGQVRCTGFDESPSPRRSLVAGLLGGTTLYDGSARTVRVAVKDAVALAASSKRTCALLRTGRVLCWGGIFSRHRAQPPRAHIPSALKMLYQAPTPRLLDGIADARAVSVSSQTSCVLRSKAVSCLGRAGRNIQGFHAPRLDLPLSATKIVMGGTLGCVGAPGGRLRCWGDPWGRARPAHKPFTARHVKGMSEVSLGLHFGCGLRDGVWCWGKIGNGEAGDGVPLRSDEWIEVVR